MFCPSVDGTKWVSISQERRWKKIRLIDARRTQAETIAHELGLYRLLRCYEGVARILAKASSNIEGEHWIKFIGTPEPYSNKNSTCT